MSKKVRQTEIRGAMEKKLSEMKYSEEGVVKRIEEAPRIRVAGMGIRVGKKIKMITKHPIKGPVVVLMEGSRTSLGLGLADKIAVEVE